MHTRLLPTDTPAALAAAVRAAVDCLQAGEPVALPTETVYGLAADALRADAVLKIFEAKERPFFDPLIVHLPNAKGRVWLRRLTEIPPEDAPLVDALCEKFWPGPLTLVLPRRVAKTDDAAEVLDSCALAGDATSSPDFAPVPDLTTSGLPTVALRMSAHPVFQAVVNAFARPLAAPSANRFGRISPTAAGHVRSELAGRIPLIVDGGETRHGVESTIVAVRGGRLEVLRDGPVTREELERFGKTTAVFKGLAHPGAVSKPVAPGQLKSHYAPRTPMGLLPGRLTESASADALPQLFEKPPGEHQDQSVAVPRLGLLAWQTPPAEIAAAFAAVETLSSSGDLREAAARLFAAMRRLDEAGLDAIVAEPLPETGLGVAIMDRLRKAAAAHPAPQILSQP